MEIKPRAAAGVDLQQSLSEFRVDEALRAARNLVGQVLS